jgi:hypothetical protein
VNEPTTASAAWGEDSGEPARPKRRIPGWVWWGCGGGCLLVTLIAVLLVFLSVRLVRDATDPEKQWPRLAEVLAFDERPANLELEFGLGIGADQFHLVDHAQRLRATLIAYPETGSDEDHLDEPLPANDPERGVLSVQGREVPVLRFESLSFEPKTAALGPGIRLDLSSASGRARTIELRRLGSGRIEDAEVEAFLAPFDVWRGR